MNNGPLHTYPFEMKVPDGDDKERHVCGDCGWIHYINPKIVTGAVVYYGDRLLLCKRAIEPRVGYWTMPAGYLEDREAVEVGAAREAVEEANAKVEIEALLGVYSIPRISQVQMIYRARLLDPEVSPGIESLEVGLFHWNEIPWDDLAFPTVHWALNHYKETRELAAFQPFGNPGGAYLEP